MKLKPAVTSQTNEIVLHVTGLSEPLGIPCYSCVNRGAGGQRILSSIPPEKLLHADTSSRDRTRTDYLSGGLVNEYTPVATKNGLLHWEPWSCKTCNCLLV